MILANCIPILIGKYISFICTSSGTSSLSHSPCKTYIIPFMFVHCSHTEIVTAIGLYIILAIALIALIIALVLFIKIMIED